MICSDYSDTLFRPSRGAYVNNLSGPTIPPIPLATERLSPENRKHLEKNGVTRSHSPLGGWRPRTCSYKKPLKHFFRYCRCGLFQGKGFNKISHHALDQKLLDASLHHMFFFCLEFATNSWMDRPFLWLPTKPKHGRYCKSLKNRLAEHLDAQLAGLLTPAGWSGR